jgi:cell wall-associated NlpC family hydrolase
VSRRLVSLVVLLACATAGTATAARPKSWADAAIRTVVARGLMADDPASFRPDDALTRGEAAALVAALTGRQSSRVAVARPDAPLDMQGLNAHLVAALGLQDAARAATAAAKAAGLAPPARFGNEVVARLLSLRTNHPAAQDALERQPTEPAPRAEAAHSVAKILAFSGAEAANARSTLATFALPALSDWQRRVLAKAVELIGRPYVWGGTSDGPQSMSGKPVPGGYDCSGFVWRVFRLQRYPGGEALAATLRGRTTYAMSGEVARAKRIPVERLQPADVVFFGAKGSRSKPSEIGHMGIYLGNGWLIHSSSQGVALVPLTGWYARSFAWARRPLAEAGLTPAA